MSNDGRSRDFRRNGRLESLLELLNDSLKTATRPRSSGVDRPILLVVGAPRSGTTYCMQWLAASGAFAYPSNFIARLWSAPFVGALIQEMLANPEFDFRGELGDLVAGPVQTVSELGKTKGLLGPNEFWYFWRNIFPGDGDIGIDLSTAASGDFDRFAGDVSRLSDVFGKPLAMKGMIVNYQLEILARRLKNTLFLFLDRDPLETALSLLRARRHFYGSIEDWYSFRPPNYAELECLDPYTQVVEQVQGARRAVWTQLRALEAGRWLRVLYEDLCREPGAVFDRVQGMFRNQGYELEGRNVFGNAVRETSTDASEERDLLDRALAKSMQGGLSVPDM
jgi:LPS sulfotransferase NodH